jgi:hypothetical protein
MSYTRLDPDFIRRDVDGAIIPADPDNHDYAAYLAWTAAGNQPTQPPAPTLAELRAARLAALADRRWRAETAGVTIDGVRFQTDRTARGNLLALFGAAKLDPTFSCPSWKLEDGSFVALSNAEIAANAMCVLAYVQACFDLEAALAGQIEAAADEAALAAIDLESGWPG